MASNETHVMDMDIDIDLAKIREQAEAAPVKEKPLVAREMPLSITYTDPEGKSYRDSLISRVPDAQRRLIFDRVVGAMVAQRGVAWQYLPTHTQLQIRACARITTCLLDPPKWVLQWVLEDDDLLFRLSNALEVHEARYFRRDPETGLSTAGKPRVVVDSIHAPGPSAQ